MMQTLNKMKEKLEKESSENKQVKQQVVELTAQIQELSKVRHWHCSPLCATCVLPFRDVSDFVLLI